MKRRIFTLAAAILAATLCSSLVFGMAKNQSKASVVGVVEWYGNAPFPRLGLKADGGTLYFLDAKKADQDTLGELHGNRLLIEGILTGERAPIEMMGAVVLQVKEWKKL